MPAPQAKMMAMQIKQLITAEQTEVPVKYKGDDDFMESNFSTAGAVR